MIRHRLRALLSRLAYHVPPRRGLHIFAWHSIGYGHPALDCERLEVEPEQFAAAIAWVRRHFDVVSCRQAYDFLRNPAGVPDGRLAVITFDDGYLGVLDYAAPILAEPYSLPYTVFVNSDVALGEMPWRAKATLLERRGDVRDDEVAFLRSLKQHFSLANIQELGYAAKRASFYHAPGLYLNASDLSTLAKAGAVLGNHTARHYILSRIPSAVARREIAACRDFLASLTDRPSPWLAVPHGEMRHCPTKIIQEMGYAPLLGVGGPHWPGERAEIGRRIVVSKRRPVWLATWLAGWRG